MHFIEAICDNSLDVQGTNIFGHIVDSIDNVVKKYPDDYFVIANRKYSPALTITALGKPVNLSNKS